MDTKWEQKKLKGATIVVVEDDPIICDLVTAVFEDLGARCVCFGSADAALARLEEPETSCSLAIVDHGIPGAIRGTELLYRMRDRWPTVPAILTSGYELDSPLLPNVIYLQKPWSLDRLVDTVCMLMKLDRSIEM